MRTKIFSLLVVFSMLLSMLGVIGPVFGEVPPVTGQTFYITTDADLVLTPDSPAGTTSWEAYTGELLLGTGSVYATDTVDYLAGNWTGHISVNGTFSGSFTVRIGRADPFATPVYAYYGEQVVNYPAATSVVSFNIPASAFSISPDFGQLILQVSAMSGALNFNAGGPSSFISAPYGSEIFPGGEPQDPPWPQTPTIDDSDTDANGTPEITGVDYVVDPTNVYLRFNAAADFTFDDQGCVVVFDIDNNPATGNPSMSPFGPAGVEYRLDTQFTDGVYSGTNLYKYNAPDTIISGGTLTVSPNNFYYTIPLGILGADAAEFANGVALDAVVRNGISGPSAVLVDQIGNLGGGEEPPSGPAWPPFPFIDDPDDDAEGIFDITQVDYTGDPSNIYVKVTAAATITYTDLNTRTYFDIDQSSGTGCDNAMTAPLGSDYYADITWDPSGMPTATVLKWDTGSGNWAGANPFDISFTKSASNYWFAITGTTFGPDFAEFGNGIFLEQVVIDMASGGNISDTASNFGGGSPVSGDNWTIMVYMAGDNNLYPSALDDINEMETIGSSDKVNIVALLDGPVTDDTIAYYVTQDDDTQNITSPVYVPTAWDAMDEGVWGFGTEANTGDPAVLNEFINRVAQDYPATHYALILWNHGDGWRTLTATDSEPLTKGIAYDEGDVETDYLSTLELDDVLAGVTAGGPDAVIPFGFGVIGLDACLMQMTEVAYQIRNYGQFMVGSEEVVNGDGFPYDTILGTFIPANEIAPVICRDFANLIVDSYHAAYPSITNRTMSAIELQATMSGGMNAVGIALHNFANAMIQSGELAGIQLASNDVEFFEDYTYIDLIDFVDQVQLNTESTAIETTGNALLVALQGAEVPPTEPVIIKNKADIGHESAWGLSIYLPLDFLPENYYSLALAQDTNWDEFVDWFLGGEAPPAEPTWTELFPDPQGDQNEPDSPDIAGVDTGALSPEQLSFRVRMQDPLQWWSISEYGFTGFDMDANKDTGSGKGAELGVMVTDLGYWDGRTAAQDAYEYDDNYSNASPITVDGDAQSHNFHVSYDLDFMSFTAVQDVSYIIETFNLGIDNDTYLILYGTNGTSILAENDDYTDLKSRIY